MKSTITLEDVQDHWEQFLTTLRADGHWKLQAFLNSASPQAVDGDVVTIAFPAGYTLHRDEIQANCDLVEGILAKSLGSQVRIRCVLVDGRDRPKVPQSSDTQTARHGPAEPQRQMAQVEAEITKTQEELKELQAERVELCQEVEALKGRKDELATELQALERTHKKMAERSRKLEETTKSLDEKAKAARQQAKKRQVEIGKLKDTKIQLESRIAELLGIRDELTTTVEDMERQKDSSHTSAPRPDWMKDIVGSST